MTIDQCIVYYTPRTRTYIICVLNDNHKCPAHRCAMKLTNVFMLVAHKLISKGYNTNAHHHYHYHFENCFPFRLANVDDVVQLCTVTQTATAGKPDIKTVQMHNCFCLCSGDIVLLRDWLVFAYANNYHNAFCA